MKIWYVYGAGGLGRECYDIIHDLLNSSNDKTIIKFLADEPKSEKSSNGIEITPFSKHIEGSWVTIAVGEPNLRRVLRDKISNTNLILKSAISKHSYVSPFSEIDDGTIIGPLCSIQTNAKLESNSLINTMSIVGHDCRVGIDSVLSSKVNLGGSVIIGNSSFIGMGALIKENVQIGNSSIIGMSSVVYRDIEDDVIAIGNPARVAKKNVEKQVFKK